MTTPRNPVARMVRVSAAYLVGGALLVAGCSPASEDQDTLAAAGEETAEASGLPPLLGAHAVAASDHLLVGVSHQPYSHDVPSEMVAVALESGGVERFAGPVEDGVPVAVEALAADGDVLLGVGDRCPPPEGGEGCQGSRALVRLDPDRLVWEVESIPVGRETTQLDGLHVLDGHVVVVESSRHHVRVLRREEDGTWETAAEVPSSRRPLSCVADGAVWLFTTDRRGSGDVGASDARYSLSRIGVDDGVPREVALPELAGYFGGVTVPFGCDGSGPVVATTPPGSVPAPGVDREAMDAALTGATVWRWRDETWHHVDLDALAGTSVADQIVSGPRGAVVRGAQTSTDGAPNRPISVVVGEGEPVVIEADGADSLLWRGTTDQVVRLYDDASGRALAVVDVGP